MGKKIVIDTCVAIDLNEHKVDFLEKLLDCLGDDKIYISTVNFKEIKNHKIESILTNSDRVCIVETNENNFTIFYSEIESKNIKLTNKDAHVLYLAKIENADFVVSSDYNVFYQTNKYKRMMRCSLLVPLNTVLLLKYLYNNNKITGADFFEKTLNIFKHKEIDNVFDHMRKENFNCAKEKQDKIIAPYAQMLKERFEMYREPIVYEFKNLWSSRIQT